MKYSLSGAVTEKMRIVAEYIWIGARDTHTDLRSKTRTIEVASVSDLQSLDFVELNERLLERIPLWNFDGSSTGQASSESDPHELVRTESPAAGALKSTQSDTEVILKPCAVCLDPFRKTSVSILVLCDCWLPTGPHPTNTRWRAAEILRGLEKERPWFGLEQEYRTNSCGPQLMMPDALWDGRSTTILKPRESTALTHAAETVPTRSSPARSSKSTISPHP